MTEIPSKMSNYVFVWPDIKDKCSIAKELPNPKEIFHSRFSFDDKYFTF